MDNQDDLLSGFDFDKLQLTERQACVWAFRAQGVTQTQIAKQWGTSRANICMLEKAAREKIERARETVLFDEQLNAPLQVTCHPGELLLDIPDKLDRQALDLDIQIQPEAVIDQILTHAPNCVRENRFVRPARISVTQSGHLHIRPLI